MWWGKCPYLFDAGLQFIAIAIIVSGMLATWICLVCGGLGYCTNPWVKQIISVLVSVTMLYFACSSSNSRYFLPWLALADEGVNGRCSTACLVYVSAEKGAVVFLFRV